MQSHSPLMQVLIAAYSCYRYSFSCKSTQTGHTRRCSHPSRLLANVKEDVHCRARLVCSFEERLPELWRQPRKFGCSLSGLLTTADFRIGRRLTRTLSKPYAHPFRCSSRLERHIVPDFRQHSRRHSFDGSHSTSHTSDTHSAIVRQSTYTHSTKSCG
jgi:hypothetical protein